MANPPSSLDQWRAYFSSTNTDIFSIIKHAIMVAANDYPNDFELNRGKIAEMMGGDIEFSVPKTADVVEKATDNDRSKHKGGDLQEKVIHREERSRLLDDVLRLKRIIDRSDEASYEMLHDSLRRLRLMPISVDPLKATGLQTSINRLATHESIVIQSMANVLTWEWELMICQEGMAETESRLSPRADAAAEEEDLLQALRLIELGQASQVYNTSRPMPPRNESAGLSQNSAFRPYTEVARNSRNGSSVTRTPMPPQRNQVDQKDT